MAQSTIGVGDGSKLTNGASKVASGRRTSIPPATASSSKARANARTSAKAKKGAARGLGFERRFTQRNADPLDQVTWERRTSVINNPDGSVVFKMDGAEIPAGWSQLATDIVVSKYFRKAGLHGKKEVGETSVRQVVHRLARTIREAGERFGGYFATAKDADTFEAESLLPPREPARRVQLARVVQLRPLPAVRHRRHRRQPRLARRLPVRRQR